jgi:hypothetical protein
MPTPDSNLDVDDVPTQQPKQQSGGRRASCDSSKGMSSKDNVSNGSGGRHHHPRRKEISRSRDLEFQTNWMDIDLNASSIDIIEFPDTSNEYAMTNFHVIVNAVILLVVNIHIQYVLEVLLVSRGDTVTQECRYYSP